MPVSRPSGAGSSTDSSRSAASSMVELESACRPARLAAARTMPGVTSSVIVEVTRSTSSWPSSTTSTSCSGSIWRPSKASMAMNEWLVTMTSTSRAASRERSTKHSDTIGQRLPRHSCGAHRHLAPGPLGHPGHELVAVAGLGDLGPVAQPHDLGAQPGRLLVDGADRHQGVGVVVGEAALELVGAQVVAPPLDEGVGGAPAEQRRERLGQARHVAVDDLGLQRQRRRGDDGRRPGVDGVLHRGHEVGQRLAGARAGLDEQVALAVDGVGDGVRHLDLPRPLGAADPADGGVEEVVEGRHQSRVCRPGPARRGPPQARRPPIAGREVGGATMGGVSIDVDAPTPFPSDIEIAEAADITPVVDLARDALGIPAEALVPYGHTKAKVSLRLPALPGGPPRRAPRPRHGDVARPPPARARRRRRSGLADALRRIGEKSVVALREPSMGPVFGIKGGAAGGGYSQVVPMVDINLAFTGDFAAIAAANNLLAAMIDNHLHQGNALGIDPRTVTWKRVVDLNDRALREIVVGLGGVTNGVPREDGFDIVVASEVMAILCLADSLPDLKRRLGDVVVGYTRDKAAGHRPRPAGRRRDDRAAARRPRPQPRADPRAHARLHPRRPVREHRPRLQLGDGHPGRPQARRLGHHRGRLRRRPRGREVHRHQVPGQRPAPRGGRRRRDGAGAEVPRRGGRGRRRPRGPRRRRRRA